MGKDHSQQHAVIFFGRSGSGKGTQAKLLAAYLKEHTDRNVIMVETGARFRELAEGESHTSLLTKDVMDNGGLMPEFLPIWVWSEVLVKDYTGQEHLIFDGVARRIEEAPVLASAVKFYNFEDPVAVYLDVPRQFAFDLMKGRGRADDTDTYINSRLDWFDTNVMPVIDYFRTHHYFDFIDVDGTRSIEEVHKDIVQKLFAHAESAHAHGTHQNS